MSAPGTERTCRRLLHCHSGAGHPSRLGRLDGHRRQACAACVRGSPESITPVLRLRGDRKAGRCDLRRDCGYGFRARGPKPAPRNDRQREMTGRERCPRRGMTGGESPQVPPSETNSDHGSERQATSKRSSRLARAVGLRRLNKHARHVTALRTLVGDQAGLTPTRSYGHDIFHCGTASRASGTGAVLSVRHEL
jgi:hypothetical protein